jgi:eukaryotic-like serine/threonine-protein kinase
MFEDHTGQTIGQYIIIRKESETSIGTTFWGRSLDLSKEVTVLFINPQVSEVEGFESRFQEYVQKAAALDNPGLVKVLDTGRLDETPPVFYITREMLPGNSLSQLLEQLKKQGSWITLGEAVCLVRQLALTLDYVYASGDRRVFDPRKVHFWAMPVERLPYTPVIDDPGIDDFFLDAQTRRNSLPAAYISPEEALQSPTDARSAVYSLGILLYELVTGQLPFPVTDLSDAARYHARQPLPPPSAWRADLPKAVEAVIVRALQKGPDQRFSSLAEMAEELNWTLPALDGLVTFPPAFERAVGLVSLYMASLGEYRSYAEKAAGKAVRVESDTKPLPKASQEGAAPPQPGTNLSLALDQVKLSVEPGRTVTTSIAVHNGGSKAGVFILGLEGVPASWISFSPREVPLNPGEQKTTQLILKPPRLSTTRAGRYSLTVRVVDSQKPSRLSQESAVLTVGAYSQFKLELPNVRVSGEETARLMVTNTGNVPDTFTIEPADASGELVFEPGQSQVRLNPGQVGQADYTISQRTLRIFGGTRSHRYSATVKSTDGSKQSLPGEYVSKSLLPTWVPLIFLIMCLCIISLAMIYVTRNQLQGTSAQRTTVAQQTGTVESVQGTSLAATETYQYILGANDATRQSITQTVQSGMIQTATAQVFGTATSIVGTATSQVATATAMAIQQTAQGNATVAAQATQTAAAQSTQLASQVGTATAISSTATAQTGLLLTATAQTGYAQTATAQSSLIRTATAVAALIQTATAQVGGWQTQTAVAATATAQANQTVTPPTRRLLYVYQNNSGLGNDYKNFLKNRGYSMDLVPVDAISSTNFSQYQLVLIGPDTGSDGTWGDLGGAWADKVESSNLPVVGLGEGGFNFFGEIGLGIGFPNGIGTSTKDAVALNTQDEVWKTPNPVPVPGNGIVPLYTKDSDTYTSNLAQPFPPGVIAFAQWPEGVNQFPIIRENRFLLWGYRASPNDFTGSGSALFLNVLDSFFTP